MATTAQTPKGRGFATSLGYFHSFNDYFNEQRKGQTHMHRDRCFRFAAAVSATPVPAAPVSSDSTADAACTVYIDHESD
jgi:hypothetical protein